MRDILGIAMGLMGCCIFMVTFASFCNALKKEYYFLAGMNITLMVVMIVAFIYAVWTART